jgi:hypothetical protein
MALPVKKVTKCVVCKCELSNPQALYCARCGKIVNRIDTRGRHNKQARIRALRRSWDGKAFRCFYTGIKLVLDNHRDPRYLTFDHHIPRREDRIVIVAAAINDMKTDMSDREFRRMVLQLANRLSGGEFDERAFNLRYWKR